MMDAGPACSIQCCSCLNVDEKEYVCARVGVYGGGGMFIVQWDKKIKTIRVQPVNACIDPFNLSSL